MEMVEYLARQVPKEHFRVVVYKAGYQMLVNSYEAFTEALSQGWHITKEAAESGEAPSAPRRGRKRNGGNST